MKITNSPNIQFKNNFIREKNTNICDNKFTEVKPVSMLFVSLLALSTLGETNINYVQNEFNNASVIATNNYLKCKSEENKKEFLELTNLLNGKQIDGSNFDIWASFLDNSDLEASKIIEKTPLFKLLPHVRKNIKLYANNSISSSILINKLIKHRFKNLPDNYKSDKDFISKSGIFKEYIDDDYSDNINNKHYYLEYNFAKIIKNICKDKEQKEQFANNFITLAINNPNIELYNNNLSKADINSAIIELLLPCQ